MRFCNGLESDWMFDILAEITGNVGAAFSILSEMESVYGSLVEGSAGARHALENGLVPFVGNKYDGDNEEYHHLYFEGTGIIAIPFKKYE